MNPIIAIVDDDPVYQFSFARELKACCSPVNILPFTEADEAIRFLRAAKAHEIPDLIFVDLNMPVMDGWEFLEEFKHLRPTFGKAVRVYMVSSSVDEADIDLAAANPELTEYLVKPVSEGLLGEMISKLKEH